jgi:pimeloyl-ACP methyl ester carboxylesterase
MRRALLRCLLVASLCAAATVRAQEAVDIASRPGVTQRVLVLAPKAPEAVVLLIPGGGGNIGLAADGRPERGGNFLVRSRQRFADQGLATLVLDVPSDRTDLNGSFRESREHAEDIAAVVRWAREKFDKPVWLVGTSRGTQSAAGAALLLKDGAAPDGLVLSSTILGRSPPRARTAVTARPVTEMPLGQLKVPVLVVHHAQDPCTVCDPARLPELMAKLPAGHSQLMTFSGGISVGAACDPFSHHGYNGIEDRVVADIAAWIRARR